LRHNQLPRLCSIRNKSPAKISQPPAAGRRMTVIKSESMVKNVSLFFFDTEQPSIESVREPRGACGCFALSESLILIVGNTFCGESGRHSY